MGVSVWENPEDLELVGRAACQIPPPQVPGTDLDPSLLASDRPTAGAWHQIQLPVC